MDSTKLRFFAPCPRGLEGVLEAELHGLGVPATTKTDGGIAFQAPWSTMYWVNLKSHIASRVLWEVGQSPYRSENDVYRAAYAITVRDWSSDVCSSDLTAMSMDSTKLRFFAPCPRGLEDEIGRASCRERVYSSV